tara:strand:- start:40 stop:510 length:471 start_codon:yes stop_codon:yes gene_type:complete
MHILPTPITQMENRKTPEFGVSLLHTLLPTPTAGDGTKASSNPDTSRRRINDGRQAFLTDIVQTDLVPSSNSSVFGKYERAITQWEMVTRAVPSPTFEVRGRPRINPVFVEWMMGLPEGHVTGHGLSTAKALKMLGNGVVPQQAAAAISQLMERTA